MARKKGRERSSAGDPIEFIGERLEALIGFVAALKVHEWAMLAIAFVPLVWVPQVLDLYDMPKRIVLNEIILLLVIFHCFASLKEAGGVLVPRSRLTAPILAYLGATALACVQALNGADAIDGALQQGLPCVLALVLLVRGVSARAAEGFVTCCLISGSIAVTVGLAQYCGVETESWGIRQVIKPASIFGNKNMAAEYLLAVLPYALYRWEQAAYRGFHSVVIAALLAFLFVSKTKATWVGTAVLLGLFAWRAMASVNLRVRLKDAAPSIAAVAFVFLLLANLPSILADNRELGLKAVAAAAKETEGSARVRLALWANSIPMLKEFPLLGVGPNNWYLHYPKYAFAMMHDPTFSTAAQAEHPHNDLIQIVGEVGLLGAAASVWIVVVLVLLALSNPLLSADDETPATRRNVFVSLSLLGILIDGIFAYPLHLAPGAGCFFVGAAILVTFTPGSESKPWRIPGGAPVVVALALVSAMAGLRDVRILRANYHYRLGAISMAGSQWKDAERHISDSLEFDATRYRTHSVLGRCLAMQGRLKDSIEQYRQALACHPNQINVLYNLAHSLRGAGQTEEAMKILERSLEVVPRFTEGLYLLGSFQKETGKRESAITTFRKLTEVSPAYADAHNELGNLLKDQKKYAEAEASYSKALQARPNYGEVFNNLGVVFLEQNKLAPAAENFKKAIQLSPSYAGSYYNLARAETGLNRFAQAVAAYREFVNRWTGDETMSKVAKAEIARLEQMVAATSSPSSPSSR
ncbi:MAG: tetratricopeptide repeat protein [Candidatus Wallbacteria bacterium]|nr:tetratricopeptide repeat protein [Candidatus Wallbacteria bacterium]